MKHSMDAVNKISVFIKNYYRLILISFSVFVVGISIGMGVYKLVLSKGKSKEVSNNPALTYNSPLVEPTATDEYSVLLLGHGGEGHSGGYLMDSIIVANIKPSQKKTTLISVPRDLFFSGRKINEEYIAEPGENGYRRMMSAVSSITGLSIENYVAVDFDNFKKAIDAVGGIDVNIIKAYEDRYYPIRGEENNTCGKSAEEFNRLHEMYSGYQLETQFECRYEHIRFDVGKIKMNGETALKYVRSRHGDGDFGRSGRQMDVLTALASSPWNYTKIESLVNLVSANISLSQVKDLFDTFGSSSLYEVKRVGVNDTNVLTSSKSSMGAYILIPKAGKENFSGVKEYIKNQM